MDKEVDNKSFNYRLELKQELQRRKEKNPSYSLRSFARDLGVSPTALSDVLSAKRNFSRTNVNRICERLEWSPLRKLQFSSQILDPVPASEVRILQEQEDVFAVMSEWYYLVILNLAKIKDNKARPHWISKKIGISNEQAKEALRVLVRLNLIEIKNGRLFRTSSDIRTVLDSPSVAIRKYHRQNFKVAEWAMDHVEVDLREISSMTFAFDPQNLDKAKKMLVDFKRKFSRAMEKGDPKEVYTLSVQFFPSHIKESKE